MSQDENMNVSLRAFQDEVAQYCEGITDNAARLYAQLYATALDQRARNLEFKEPHNPSLFGPNRNLIRAALLASYRRHFGPLGQLRKQVRATITDAEGN